MEISALELKTILNKIVAKRKLPHKGNADVHLLTFNFLSLLHRN